MSLIDYGFPDLYPRKKEQAEEREKEERMIVSLLHKAREITTTQDKEGKEFKLEIITESGFKCSLLHISVARFRKLYPESWALLLERGLIPIDEL